MHTHIIKSILGQFQVKCHSHAIAYQALSLFNVQHRKAGSDLGTRLVVMYLHGICIVENFLRDKFYLKKFMGKAL